VIRQKRDSAILLAFAAGPFAADGAAFYGDVLMSSIKGSDVTEAVLLTMLTLVLTGSW